MEYVRVIVDSSVLDNVLTLPRSFHDRKVEILVFPVPDNEKKVNINQKKSANSWKARLPDHLLGRSIRKRHPASLSARFPAAASN
jgi:hypothetical protein